jgi:hypothetical protein
LKILIYLTVGFVDVLLLGGWALKQFGPPKKWRASTGFLPPVFLS